MPQPVEEGKGCIPMPFLMNENFRLYIKWRTASSIKIWFDNFIKTLSPSIYIDKEKLPSSTYSEFSTNILILLIPPCQYTSSFPSSYAIWWDTSIYTLQRKAKIEATLSTVSLLWYFLNKLPQDLITISCGLSSKPFHHNNRRKSFSFCFITHKMIGIFQ